MPAVLRPFGFLSVVLILRRTENVRSASELVTGNTDPMVNKIRMFGNTSPSAYFKQPIILSGKSAAVEQCLSVDTERSSSQ